MMFTWKIGGEAGFGIMASGAMFSKIASRRGYYIFDYVEYPSLIRGGHNAFEVCVSEEEIFSHKKDIDCLVCLNEETFKLHSYRLTTESLVIFDSQDFNPQGNFIKIDVPFKKILSELKGEIVMKNTLALGASLSVLGGGLDELLEIIEKQFSKKGEAVVQFNQQFAIKGFEYVRNNYSSLIRPFLIKKESETKLVLSGNEAFSLGSIIADCRLYSAYPMTPSSSVLATLAAWQEKTGMVVRHAEDEIAVINTALGSSFAGVRSAIGTSGGGFALMVESISLAGITEIPIVIFLAQRPGPATGMPTWTEQGDLLFAVHSGHGEFPKIVLAPGDVEEMIRLTGEAFNLADVYQLPVIIISDMLLSESHKSLTKKFLDNFINEYQIKRGKTINQISKSEKYLRYQLTDDGISPRLIPGASGHFYQANSYEHFEDGHTTEKAIPRINQVDKRNKKWQTYITNDFKLPNFYGFEESDLIFVSWGANKGAILEAQKKLAQEGVKTGFWHFNYLYPLDEEKIKPLFQKKAKYVLIENNSWGQFGKLLRQETGIEIKEKILKYDGRPIWPEEIIGYIKNKNTD